MSGTAPKPPRAEKRPRVETWHGYEKRDDYHWLKAENWQEVMHDPSVLPAEIRAVLEGENNNVKSNLLVPSAVTRMAEGLDISQYPAMEPELVSPLVGWLCHENCDVTGEMFG